MEQHGQRNNAEAARQRWADAFLCSQPLLLFFVLLIHSFHSYFFISSCFVEGPGWQMRIRPTTSETMMEQHGQQNNDGAARQRWADAFLCSQPLLLFFVYMSHSFYSFIYSIMFCWRTRMTGGDDPRPAMMEHPGRWHTDLTDTKTLAMTRRLDWLWHKDPFFHSSVIVVSYCIHACSCILFPLFMHFFLFFVENPQLIDMQAEVNISFFPFDCFTFFFMF